MIKKKAYGYPVLVMDDGLSCGLCFSEEGKYLGRWISSSIDFLKADLAKHAIGYDYSFFEYFDQLPSDLKIKIEKQTQAMKQQTQAMR